MNGYHYISYEPEDGRDFALWLSGELDTKLPQHKTWLDELHMQDNGDFANQAAEALKACTSLILVLTPKAVSEVSRVGEEWKSALSYKKPITIAIAVDTVRLPNRLELRPAVDFSQDRQAALGNLMMRLERLTTVEGKLDALMEQLRDAQRDRKFAPLKSQQRIDADTAVLNEQINAFSAMIENPAQVESLFEARIASGLERDRRPTAPPSAPSLIRFVNPPPGIAPSYFQNRFVETKLAVDFLKDNTKSLLMITGKGGVGKTALVCRLLKSMEKGVVPDSEEKIAVGGIIYMNQIGSRQINAANLFADLLLLIAPELRKPFEQLQQNAQATIQYKLKALLPALPSEPIVILMDNFEDLVNRDTRRVIDQELVAALTVLLQFPHHNIKVMLTTRVTPQDFVFIEPARQMSLVLDEGLESPYAENILREMDADGHARLRSAEGTKLTQLREMTRGFPKAIEAVYAILSGDRDTTIDDLLAAPHPPEHIIRLLVGEAYSRLNETDQRVMQALAIYGSPVSSTAVDYLLKPWFSPIDGGLSLKRLVNMHLVRKETGLYYLHPLDREHALRQLPISNRGDESESLLEDSGRDRLASHDRTNRFRIELTERAADYFREISLPRIEWTTLNDVVPQIREFHLRLDAGDDQTAASILETVSKFIEKRGGFEKVLTLASRLGEHARSSDAQKEACRLIAVANWRLGRIKSACEAQKKLIKLIEEDSDEFDAKIARGNLAIFQDDEGDNRMLLESHEEFQAFLQQHPWEKSNRAITHNNIAECLRTLGYLERAATEQQAALTLARETGEIDSIEAQTHNLASAKRAMGQIREAKGLYEEALQMAEQSKNPLWKANHISSMADISDDLGKPREALKYIDQATKLHREIGDLKNTASDLRGKAEYQISAGDVAAAKETARAALQQALDLGVRLESYQEVLAEILLLTENVAEAEEILAAIPDRGIEESKWHRFNLHGIAALKQGSEPDAKLFFTKALGNAEEWLKRCDQNHKAWAAKGLAMAGLFMIGESIEIEDSRHAYRMAGKICREKGIIAQRLRMFLLLTSDFESEQLTEIARFIQPGYTKPTMPEPPESSAKPDVKTSSDAPEMPYIVPRVKPTRQKILFLAANPKGTTQLALDEECRQITQIIKMCDNPNSLELITRWAVQPDDLLQHLYEHSPNVVHFSGHGTPTDEIVLLDKDGNAKTVSARALKQLFTTLKDNIRVVVLNACFSKQQAAAITEVIDCAVGMNKAIGDKAAITFAAHFYQAIGFGRSVKVAFESGKTALMLAGIPEEDTPELLCRPDVDPATLVLIQPSIAQENPQ